MLQIAIEMLLGDKVKYLVLISGLAFSTLLMTQQSSIFWGVMRWTTTMLRNTNVPVWVVDPHVEQITDIKPLRDTDLMRVRSVPGVDWALPFYYFLLEGKIYNGSFMTLQLMGVDSSTLTGVPPVFVKGRLEDLWQAGAVIVDEEGLKKLSKTLEKPLDIGDFFDINDHEVKIVGIVKAEQSFFGYPFIYTTYERAIEIAPRMRKNLSFVLVKPKPGVLPDQMAKSIETKTGLRAYTSETFFWKTMRWFFVNTGIPVSFGATIILGFVIGIAVAGQTFYSFVNENLGNFSALKAMGADNRLLRRMVFCQAFAAGFVGYGIGLGITILNGVTLVRWGSIPFYFSWHIPLVTFCMIVLISFFSAFLSIRKIETLEASEVFRV
ncbi:ABC transporter permease [Parachlamydia sp. AcF125]|uniref:ABC transporter permease n=1 Tax=Parachlamydia sp. AcF125 TaxID=2795736 RepID=UPI001BC98958|nr:ABC transporter permease [Parachlamydia sp. AcF125]MBS4168702.1 hypothetical protein [Parachlamydia sp. AcF125]